MRAARNVPVLTTRSRLHGGTDPQPQVTGSQSGTVSLGGWGRGAIARRRVRFVIVRRESRAHRRAGTALARGGYSGGGGPPPAPPR